MVLRANFKKVRALVLVILLLVASFSGGYALGFKGFKAEITKSFQVRINRETPPDKNVDMSLFWQVWDTLSEKYYDKSKLKPSDMVYGAISGMVSAVGDPYTMFLTPKENKVVNEDLSGTLEGVGIEIGYKEGKLAVVAPLEGSPAEKAGVKAGDFIARIKDEGRGIDVNASTLSLPEAVQTIRGKAGTKVTLTLVRNGELKPVVVELTRAKLTIPSVTLKFEGKDKNIADIKISKFDAETPNQWDKAVEGILNHEAGIRGIIIDLRNNPGGYLQDAIDIASEFVPTGTVVVAEQKGDGTKVEYKSEKLGRLQKYKVVVLINGGSASASEILAGALRDDRHFKLIGEKSFGKGTVQEPLDIAGGSGLHVTIAKWLTPDGTWVHEKGLEPDVKVLDDEKTTEDEQVQKAINLFD